MEPDGKEDLVTFMRKRSETGAPQYTAKIKTYLNIKQKFVLDIIIEYIL